MRDRLIDLADASADGAVLSICGGGWQPYFIPSYAAFGRSSCFFLGNLPWDRNGNGVVSDTEGELRVFVDGNEVPSSEHGAAAWRYDPDRVAVCFEPLYVPEGGSRIEVEYRVACSPW